MNDVHAEHEREPIVDGRFNAISHITAARMTWPY